MLGYVIGIKVDLVRSDNPPNIILIVADDLGYNDVGFHGSDIFTPNLDKLANSGVILENYYVQASCTPSRGQLLTGRYGIHTGLNNNFNPLKPTCLSLDELTIAQKLKERNYKTHMLGKWHLGYYHKNCTPTKRGFDSFYGIHLGSGNHYSHFKTEKRPFLTSGYDFWRGENVSWIEGTNGSYSTTLYRDEALDIISNHNSSQPMFMFLSFQAPHSPLLVPPQWLERYRGIKDWKRQTYAGMVTALDSAVGDLVQRLKKHGLWQNTVLVFTTDNGGQVISGGSNWPLRGGKGSFWEGGVRGVGFVNSPLINQSARKSRHLMHISDWFPTFVRLSRGNLNGSKPLDGVDQWDSISDNHVSSRQEILLAIWPGYLRDKLASWRHHPACRKYLPKTKFDCRKKKLKKPLRKRACALLDSCVQYNNSFWCNRAAIRWRQWKLLVNAQKSGNWLPVRSSGNNVVCASRQQNKKRLHLFDIKNDPREMSDLSEKYPDIVDQLMTRLEKYRSSSVPYVKTKKDFRGLPKYNGGVWGPWGNH